MRSIAHIGIAVKDIDIAIATYTRLLGVPPAHREEVTDQRVTTAMFALGPSSVELLQATSPESPIARFLEKRGEGIHHVCFEVDDIVASLREMQREGFQLIDTVPRRGAGGYLVAFVHPRSANGVLIELGQRIGLNHGS